MLPAPRLPSTLEEPTADSLPVPALSEEIAHARTHQAISAAETPPGEALPVETPPGSAIEGLSQLVRTMSTMHAAHMERSAALHESFLEMRRRTSLLALSGAPATTQAPRPAPERVVFSRANLEDLPGGKVYPLLGPELARVVPLAHQTRLPRPPLLLADRVTVLEGAPASLSRGRIRAETDTARRASLLDPAGRLPASVIVETVQIQLLLNAHLGADLRHEGDRVQRLSEVDIVFHAPLPRANSTLTCEFAVENVAAAGDTTLFISRSTASVDGTLIASSPRTVIGVFPRTRPADVRGSELDPKFFARPANGPFDPPTIGLEARTFSREAVRAFAEGDGYTCFGPSFERLATHVRPPRIHDGDLRLIDEVTAFEPFGGPWNRGYVRAEMPVKPDAWFFAAHFPDDPCLPGVFMLEGCLQTLAFTMAGVGLTVGRDGWRFEPAHEQTFSLKFSRPITPENARITFEIFVESMARVPTPTVIADLVCRVDGEVAFSCRRFALRLVPDLPFEDWRHLPYVAPGAAGPLPTLGGIAGYRSTRPCARIGDLVLDYPAFLAGAWGSYAEAFGVAHARFDRFDRVLRLPGPPFLFLTRATAWEGAKLAPGSTATTEYDAPHEAWYLSPSNGRVMPFPVLLEALLQACGWFNTSLVPDGDLLQPDAHYRNLDGEGVLHGEVRPGEILASKVTLTSVSRSGKTCLFGFAIESFAEGRRIFDVKTVFGLFPAEGLKTQAGLAPSAAQQERIARDGDFRVDLASRPPRYFDQRPSLPGAMLRMLDRVTAYEPRGGAAGLGWARGELDVSPHAWFFKSHFFTDPVQPGSLGLEAMLQLLEFVMIEQGLGDRIENARFEAPMLGRPIKWKYRGQVLPESRRVTTEVELKRIDTDDEGRPFAVADAWLWVDGTCVYSIVDLAVRVVRGDGDTPKPLRANEGPSESPAERPAFERTLDLAADAWLADHRPTWTVPSVPIVVMADLIAAGARMRAGRAVTRVSNCQVRRFMLCAEPVRIRVDVGEVANGAATATLLAWREARTKSFSRFEPVATATVHFDAQDEAPAPFAPIECEVLPDPYDAGTVFHGPAFQVVRSARIGARGASGVLALDRCRVPDEGVHPGLLDAMFHILRMDVAELTWPDAPADRLALPHRIDDLVLHRPIPTEAREIDIEARIGVVRGDYATLSMQLLFAGAVLASMSVTMVLLPSPFRAESRARRAFIRDRIHVPGLALGRHEGNVTIVEEAATRRLDWLPGTVASIYLVPEDRRHDLAAEVAIREHVGRIAECHPSAVSTRVVGHDVVEASTARMRTTVRIGRANGSITVAPMAETAETGGARKAP